MDDLSLIISVGLIILLLATIWAWTSIKVKTIDHLNQTAITATTTEGHVTAAKLTLEGIKQSNSTKESIAILHDQTELAKIQAEKEYRDKHLLLQQDGYKVQLEQERIRQDGNSSIAQLKYVTKTNIAEMDVGFRNRKLNTELEMFSKRLDFDTEQLHLHDKTEQVRLGIQRDGIEAKERTQRYLADSAYKGIELGQRHEDARHQLSLDTSKAMHYESMSVKRELGMASLESNERVQLKGFECRVAEAMEATNQKQIEAESSSNMINALVGTALSVVTKGIIPTGGGNSGRLGGGNRKALPPSS